MPFISQPSLIVSSNQIAAGVIVNSDINASAAIDQSKLALSVTNAEVNASAAIVDTKLAQIATASKVSGAALTSLSSIPSGAGIIPAANVAAFGTVAVGVTSKNCADASTTQNIAHGLGKTPAFVRLVYVGKRSVSAESLHYVHVIYNGTTQAAIYYLTNGAFADETGQDFQLNASTAAGMQTGVITFDATNIIITWTKTSSPTGSYLATWEAWV